MRQRLEAEEETANQLNETFTSLRQEVDAKSKRVKKLAALAAALARELADTRVECNRDREELTLMQNQFTRDLKRSQVIVDNFVPPAERMKILGLAEWDDDGGSGGRWRLKKPILSGGGTGVATTTTTRRPMSAVGARRPVSEYARKQNSRIGSAARYKVGLAKVGN
jgi:kinesin family protein 3/17